jgi:hypothetical protein
MSTAPKGYSTSQKLDRLSAEYACVNPVGQNSNGLVVNASLFVFSVGTDQVDAGSTTDTIVAAAHAALRGDVIRFTSGALSGVSVAVASTTTNNIILGEDLSVAPTALDDFVILRYINPVANSVGSLSTALSYIRDGLAQDVIEDTVTPANNRPLPVKIESTSGEVNITAGDLNVQMEHDGASPASVRIGDGFNLLGITGDLEAKVRVNSTAGLTKAIAPTYNDYGTTPVTTAAYVELVASTGDQIRKVQIFDSSGETLEFATGAAGAEVPLFYIFPGGVETLVDIPLGTRLSLKAVTANATAGYFAMNAWK